MIATPADDAAPADWVRAALKPWPDADGGVRLHSLVPSAYSSYATVPTGEGIDFSQERAKRMAVTLEQFTNTPDRCWFGIWEGYGSLDESVFAAPTFELPGRRYHLFYGPCAAGGNFWTGEWFQAPDLWWPEDRVWFVGGDTDLDVYVAGEARLINVLLNDEALEARPASLADRVDAGA